MPSLGTLRPGNSASPTGWSTATNGALGDDSDTTYGASNANGGGTTDVDQGWVLADTPSDFGTMDTVSVQLRYGWAAAFTNRTWNTLGARIMDGATVLAAADSGGAFQTVVSTITNTTPATSSAVGFSHVNTTADKAAWDAATLELRINSTRSAGGSTVERRVHEGWITGTYTVDSGPTTHFGEGSGSVVFTGTGTGLRWTRTSSVRLKFGPLLPPDPLELTTVVRYYADEGLRDNDGRIYNRLWCGSTFIEETYWSYLAPPWSNLTRAWNPTNLANITDWSDLSLEIWIQDRSAETGNQAYIAEVWATAPAAGTPSGSGSGTIVFTGTATGTPTRFGAGSGTLAFTGTATGTPTHFGSGAGTVTFTGSATGTVTRYASASGVITLSGAATGERTTTGEGSGSVVFTGTATSSVTRYATASGSIVLTGTATGARTAVGEGAGSVAFTGTATGLRTAVGEGAGTVTFTAAATGTPTKFATAAGTVEFSGTATGSGTAGTIYGAGAGTVTFSGTATGIPTRFASAAGTVTFDGSATGTPVRLGEGSGTVAFTGTVTGAKTAYGSAAGTVTFTATATGNRTAFASGSGTVTFTATATGTPTRFAAGSGTIVFTGTATSTQQLVRPISTITVGGWDTAPTAGQLLYVYTSDESETTYIFDLTA